MREYREAIRLKPNYSAAHNGLGRALARRGDVPGAMQAFREAIRLEPDSSMSHSNLGAMLMQEGYLQGAQQELQDAIRLKPDNALAHHNLGLLFQRLGNWNGAMKEFQEACRFGDAHSCDYLSRSAGCATVANSNSNKHVATNMDVGLVFLMIAAPLRFIRKKLSGES
jgi:Tfp pilus assembly protein PilF